MKHFDELSPGGQLSAQDYNRLAQTANQSTRITVEPPLEITPDMTGTHIRCILPGFWAQLTNSTSPYSWVEVRTSGDGIFEPYGRFGELNAYEVNEQKASEGAIVWMTQNNNAEFLFLFIPIIETGSSGGSGGASSGNNIVSVEIAQPPFTCGSGSGEGQLTATTSYLNFENGLFLSLTLAPLGMVLTPE